MDILGIDFTSRPRRGKPITCLRCRLKGNELHAGQLEEWSDFASFESALKRPGPWIAGIDFPFGQARKFIETIGWPATWQSYVQYTGTLDRSAFRKALDSYRESRPGYPGQPRIGGPVFARFRQHAGYQWVGHGEAL